MSATSMSAMLPFLLADFPLGLGPRVTRANTTASEHSGTNMTKVGAVAEPHANSCVTEISASAVSSKRFSASISAAV